VEQSSLVHTIPVEWGRGGASRHNRAVQWSAWDGACRACGGSFFYSITHPTALPKNPPPAETGPTLGDYLFPGLTRSVSAVHA
jgi:hypothetical protein